MLRSLTLPASLLSFCIAFVEAQIQFPGLQLPPSAAANKELVVEIFVDAYTDYTKYAYPHDALAPLTRSWSEHRNGWGATIFDAMTTMKMMNLTELFEEAVTFASSVDFSHSRTPGKVNFFETVIRYLGSMLSAYQLNGMVDKELLENAQRLGDKVMYSFTSDGPIPYGFLYFVNNTAIKLEPDQTISIGGAGSNILEFFTLSKLTGNDTYRDFAEKCMSTIAKNEAPYPGLASQDLRPNGSSVGDHLTWGGGSDSYFEYLMKYARMTDDGNSLWRDTWLDAVDSTIQHLISYSNSTTGTRTWLANQFRGNNTYHMEDLTCFVGGNWIMGGKLVGNQTIVDYGLNLTNSCMEMYHSTTTGMGGAGWGWITDDGRGDATPSEKDAFHQERHGLYFTDPKWETRPETIESVFYAWRVTGDLKYQTWAASILKNLRKYAKAPVGYSSIKDVMNDQPIIDNLGNYLESFFFAEVLKYLFLIFDDPEHISLDEWVFNTEAHPFSADTPGPWIHRWSR